MAGEYTPEVLIELERMVARDLSCWGLAPATAIRLLNVSENATFALTDPVSARQLVLRVHRVGYCTAQEIRSELAWIDALRRDAVIETAAPISTWRARSPLITAAARAGAGAPSTGSVSSTPR